MDTEFKSERLIVLVEPSRRKQIEDVASDPEFKVNGQPSSAAVVRAALDLFFAQRVRNTGHQSEYSDDNAPLCPECSAPMEWRQIGKERMDPDSEFGPVAPVRRWCCDEHFPPITMPPVGGV